MKFKMLTKISSDNLLKFPVSALFLALMMNLLNCGLWMENQLEHLKVMVALFSPLHA